MNLLAIESSFETCSVALRIGDDVQQRIFHEPQGQGARLLPSVRELLAGAEIGFSQLDALAFSCGPGSFTSLRMGIGVVQGLAWASNLGVIPVSSLQTTALCALDNLLASGHDRARELEVFVAMDARMGEVFFCRYSLGSSGLPTPAEGIAGTEHVAPPEAALASTNLTDRPDTTPSGAGSLLLAGNGFQRYPALENWSEQAADKHSAIVMPDVWPEAGALTRLAIAWLENAEPLDASLAQPVYLRDKVTD